MNEDDFRVSLRDAIDSSTPPPPMSAAVAVTTGRRAARRRNLLAGGAAAAVTVVVAAVAAAVAGGGLGSAAPQQAGAPGGTPAVTAGTPGNDKQVWPTGPDGQPQEDRTARAGTRFDQGEQLLVDLLAVVPAGYTALNNPGTDQLVPSRMSQAQFENKVGGKDAWSYLASTQLGRDGGVGQLLVTVYEPGLITATGDACAVAGAFWTTPASCRPVTTTAGVTVGVAVGTSDGYEQWAAYRHADGTVVFLAQTKADNRPGGGGKGLTALPLPEDRLAALVVDERFHITA
ncbi:hypothetical protein OHA72_17535 [Dactylosporangium sp. NBC_01737]|uniref:hypothetical protein n=1 Tax=Dactylosporangium sp. NBC_01737 TaxID=2975959 RepID=UPI002E14E10F|nr:hypothetical protein OHA72_17535 [Dactylosporangium sp. NBC_01737]